MTINNNNDNSNHVVSIYKYTNIKTFTMKLLDLCIGDSNEDSRTFIVTMEEPELQKFIDETHVYTQLFIPMPEEDGKFKGKFRGVNGINLVLNNYK